MSDAKLQKEALVIALDVGIGSNGSSGTDFAIAKDFCSNIIQQKILFHPKTDEVSLLLGGTPGTLNSINTSDPNSCKNITVSRPLMPPSMDFLKAVEEATCNNVYGMDILDTLVVAADLLHQRCEGKKFSRTIYLVTGATVQVQRKDLLEKVKDGLKKQNVNLIVIGINFEDPDEADDEDGSDADWNAMSDKQKNEKILRWICGELGQDSGVVCVAEAQYANTELRKRMITQRTSSRCVLSIGEIKIPVNMYSKTMLTRPPTMKRSTDKGDFTVEKRYFSVSAPEKEIAAGDRVKALRYGKSIIPFQEVDEASLKFKSNRSLQCITFLPTSAVPVHFLIGGVKAVLPFEDDECGQKALSAFVQGMSQLDKVMLARFVWRENSNPVLGVLMPHPGKDILYWAPLPFSEDLRCFQFRTFEDVKMDADEIKAVDDLIHSMNLDGELKPKETFNPAIQQYYNAVAKRLTNNDCPIPDLPAPLKRQSCAWGEPGNVLEPIMSHAKPNLETVAKLFPFKEVVDPKSSKDKGAKVFWFAKDGPSAAAGATAGAATSTAATTSPSKTGRPLEDDESDLNKKKKKYEEGPGLTGASTATSQTHATPMGMPDTSQLATPSSEVSHVTTIDPVASFLALVNKKGVDCVSRAIFEMTAIIKLLLRDSTGSQYYSKCDAAIDVLRKICIREGEPNAFNTFLRNDIMLVYRGESHHDVFWREHILGRGVKPIASDECPESSLSPAGAASYLSEDVIVHKPVAEPDDVQDLFGGLE